MSSLLLKFLSESAHHEEAKFPDSAEGQASPEVTREEQDSARTGPAVR